MEATVALKHLHTLVNAVLSDLQRKFCCGSLLPVFGVRVAVKFKLTCVHLIFSSVSVAEWQSFKK